MKIVSELDKKLMEELRKKFNDAKSRSSEEQRSRSLITSTSICFVDYFDQDRMKPLQKIANKVLIYTVTKSSTVTIIVRD